MKRHYFGTDGVRGKVGQVPITPDFALRLAYAVGCVLKQTEKKPLVVIGKDTRISGYMLESALESGFSSAGVNVVLLGPLPTAGVAYLTRALRASLGVVISASHNPFDDNGIKFFSAQGSKFSDEWELSVEAKLEDTPQWVDSEHLGKARRLDDAAGRYIEFCKNTLPRDLSLQGIKIVVDAANGAAYQIAPAVFHELEAQVIPIAVTPDGFNINKGVGATHPEIMVETVLHHRADFGVALDGDADRVVFVDAQGRIYNGDELLYILAVDRLKSQSPLSGVVGTIMTNLAIEQAFIQSGIPMVRAQVGDRYVLQELLARNWLLGGESSGHLLILDKHTTGDGIISALQVLQACVRQNKTLSEFLSGVDLYPQTMVNVRLSHPAAQDWRNHAAFQKQYEDLQHVLGQQGRIVIRPSGTEPVLRIMVEARDAQSASLIANQLAQALN